MITALIPSIP
jgi:hypothetical protein